MMWWLLTNTTLKSIIELVKLSAHTKRILAFLGKILRIEILATAILYVGAIPHFENLIENVPILIYAGQILCNRPKEQTNFESWFSS